MINELLQWHHLATLFLLVGLELVLGVDNIIVLSLVVAPLSETRRNQARKIGLSLALVFRLLLVSSAFYLVKLTQPLISHFSMRDVILFLGGFFLIWKSCKELYFFVVLREVRADKITSTQSMLSVVFQLVVLDLVFSIDSVITAVGLTPYLPIIFIAVVLSFAIVLLYVQALGEFIIRHPSLKILALAFIVVIGISLVAESFDYIIDKKIIYYIMVFSLIVEFLQMQFRKNKIS